MNITKLKEDWEKEGKGEEFNELVKKNIKYNDILDKVFNNRIELFQKMEIDNVDEQRNLVDLINNVVWERQISLDKTKSDLELCFTPKLQDKLESGKYEE